MKLEFFRHIFAKYSNIKFNYIRPVGSEVFHADRQTNMIKLVVAFRNFAKALKNEFETCYFCRILMKLDFTRHIFEKY